MVYRLLVAVNDSRCTVCAFAAYFIRFTGYGEQCTVFRISFRGSPFAVYGLRFVVYGLCLKLMSAARVKQAEIMAEQQRTLKERAERAQRQRRAAAAAKKAAREKRTESQARARRCRDTMKPHERIQNLARRTDDDLDHL